MQDEIELLREQLVEQELSLEQFATAGRWLLPSV